MCACTVCVYDCVVPTITFHCPQRLKELLTHTKTKTRQKLMHPYWLQAPMNKSNYEMCVSVTACVLLYLCLASLWVGVMDLAWMLKFIHFTMSLSTNVHLFFVHIFQFMHKTTWEEMLKLKISQKGLRGWSTNLAIKPWRTWSFCSTGETKNCSRRNH